MFQKKQKLLFSSIALFTLLFSIAQISFAAEDGSYVDAAPYLRLGAGSRSLGLGGAFTAIADDATATVWNPAGLPSIWTPSVKGYAFTFSTSKLAHDSTYNFLSVVKQLNQRNSIGLSWIRFGVENILQYDNQGERRGDFGYNSNAYALSYGHSLGTLNIGASARILADGFGLDTVDSQTGFGGVDIGVIKHSHYHTTHTERRIPTFSYGLALKYLGSSIAGGSVPMLLDAGVAFRLIRKDMVTFALDVEYEFVDLGESTTKARMGVEYLIANTFALRGGGLATRDRRSLFAGFGVNVSEFQVDYAYKLNDNTAIDLGLGEDTHFVSLSYGF